jgi:hypothetical protein
MKSRRLLALLGLALAWACREAPARPEQSAVLFRNDTTDTLSPVVVNRRWLVSRLAPESTDWLVILERDSATWCGGEAEWCHTLSLSGWVGKRDLNRVPDWKATAVAAPGDLDARSNPNFYRAVHPGCCDVREAFSYFNIRTGARDFRSSLPLVEFEESGSKNSRYIGFLDTWSALQPDEQASNRGLGGVLQFGAPGGPVDRALLIEADTLLHCCRIERVLILGGDFDAAAGTATSPASRPAIRLILLPDYDMDSIVVDVPVSGGRLDVARAVLPPGITLRR